MIASLEIVAPALQQDASGSMGIPLMVPFLFVTIACGAISGFHCLVSSGTSSKQLSCERDARFVGYGSMLTEGFLAVLVILACVAGLGLGLTKETAAGATTTTPGSKPGTLNMAFSAAKGLDAKSGPWWLVLKLPQVLGLGGLCHCPDGLFVASFAATTLAPPAAFGAMYCKNSLAASSNNNVTIHPSQIVDSK